MRIKYCVLKLKHIWEYITNKHQRLFEMTKYKNTSETIEFFIPKLGLDIERYLEEEDMQGIHHVGRYYWAINVLREIKSKKILDIGCGSGYGSYIISQNLPNTILIGADYDERAISFGTKNYKKENLKCVLGNITTWNYRNSEGKDVSLGQYDAIISFDTIEHILHREIMLINIAENLSDDGILLFSTPCSHSITQLKPAWTHHKIEYNSDDLFNLLRRFFRKVLRPEDGNLPHIEFWNDAINRGKIRYLNKTNPLVCYGPIKLR